MQEVREQSFVTRSSAWSPRTRPGCATDARRVENPRFQHLGAKRVALDAEGSTQRLGQLNGLKLIGSAISLIKHSLQVTRQGHSHLNTLLNTMDSLTVYFSKPIIRSFEKTVSQLFQPRGLCVRTSPEEIARYEKRRDIQSRH